MLNRRGFLGGLLVALAAPAIIRPGLLMKVSAPKLVIPRFATLADAMASGADVFDIDGMVPMSGFGPTQVYQSSPEIQALVGFSRRALVSQEMVDAYRAHPVLRALMDGGRTPPVYSGRLEWGNG